MLILTFILLTRCGPPCEGPRRNQNRKMNRLTPKASIKNKLARIQKLEDRQLADYGESEQLQTEVANALAPGFTRGDFIEGGSASNRKRGWFRHVDFQTVDLPCVVYYNPIGARGQRCGRLDRFDDPATVEKLPQQAPRVLKRRGY